jgi:hypothetical protein
MKELTTWQKFAKEKASKHTKPTTRIWHGIEGRRGGEHSHKPRAIAIDIDAAFLERAADRHAVAHAREPRRGRGLRRV